MASVNQFQKCIFALCGKLRVDFEVIFGTETIKAS